MPITTPTQRISPMPWFDDPAEQALAREQECTGSPF
jgi:hypothetical protein